MGQEEEKAEREKIFKNYQINDEVMAAAKPDAMVLHCLPRTGRKKLLPKCLMPTPTRSLTKQKTACTPKRPCL